MESKVAEGTGLEADCFESAAPCSSVAGAAGFSHSFVAVRFLDFAAPPSFAVAVRVSVPGQPASHSSLAGAAAHCFEFVAPCSSVAEAAQFSVLRQPQIDIAPFHCPG